MTYFLDFLRSTVTSIPGALSPFRVVRLCVSLDRARSRDFSIKVVLILEWLGWGPWRVRSVKESSSSSLSSSILANGSISSLFQGSTHNSVRVFGPQLPVELTDYGQWIPASCDWNWPRIRIVHRDSVLFILVKFKLLSNDGTREFSASKYVLEKEISSTDGSWLLCSKVFAN